MPEIIQSNRRRLPHYQREDDVLSVTMRLAFTLPASMLQELNEIAAHIEDADEAELMKYQYFDEYLGKNDLGDISLCQPDIAKIVCGAIEYYDSKLYELHAYCLMPNHVHLLIKPNKSVQGSFAKIAEIVRNLKSYTSKEINKLTGHSGKVWEEDYYDRFIRSIRDYGNTVTYILNNPVKAGLVKEAEEWLYSKYISREL